ALDAPCARVSALLAVTPPVGMSERPNHLVKAVEDFDDGSAELDRVIKEMRASLEGGNTFLAVLDALGTRLAGKARTITRDLRRAIDPADDEAVEDESNPSGPRPAGILSPRAMLDDLADTLLAKGVLESTDALAVLLGEQAEALLAHFRSSGASDPLTTKLL